MFVKEKRKKLKFRHEMNYLVSVMAGGGIIMSGKEKEAIRAA